MMRGRIEEAPGILDAALAQQGRLLMESAQKQHFYQRLIDFEFDDDGFIGCYRQSHPEGKTVSRGIDSSAWAASVRRRVPASF